MKSDLLSRILLSAFLSFGVSIPGHAGEKALDSLLKRRDRPTLSQVYRAMDGNLATNPFDHELREEDDNYSENLQAQLEHLPRVIAFIERAFPGATWAPLGRDAVIFGDVLDAFYLSIGQKNRVARLNASGTSLYNADDKARVRFLKSAGLNLKKIKNSPPFVGMDRTSFSNSSQSTNLIRAAYAKYANQGGKPSDLIRKLNFLGLSGGEPDSSLNLKMIKSYFAKANARSGSLSGIMQIPTAGFTDSSAWHDSFGPLRMRPNGHYEGTPGVVSEMSDRVQILGEMIEIFRQVSRPKFILAVQKEARKLGYQFPLSQKANEDFLEKTLNAQEKNKEKREKEAQNFVPDLGTSLNRVTSRLSPPPERPRGYFTNNAIALLNWLTDSLDRYDELAEDASEEMKTIPQNTVTLHFIDQISTLYRAQMITRRDYRRLLARALSASDPDQDFLKYFAKLYKNYPELQATLIEKATFFLTTWAQRQREGTENTEDVYNKIREVVMKKPVDCAEENLEPAPPDETDEAAGAPTEVPSPTAVDPATVHAELVPQ